MMKNKDRKAKLSSAYHEFSIHRRLFWLVSFLRFAIPCCDFPHDELSWRKSWDDDLNLEVIQQLYILTASFAPEHRINIQWNQSCQHDRRHLLFSRVSNEIQGISNRIVRMRDISLLCSSSLAKNVVRMRCAKNHVWDFQRCNWFRSENAREKRIRKRSDGCRVMAIARWLFFTSARNRN